MAQAEARFFLAGDVGGTKTLLAIGRSLTERDEVIFERRYDSERYSDFSLLLTDFLAVCPAWAKPSAACLAVAGPVEGGSVKVTNLPWRLDAADIVQALGARAVSLINDFEGVALGLDELQPEDFATLQEGEALAGAPRLVIGAGTGLGIAFMAHDGERYRVIPTEAGRTAFAPADYEELDLWRFLYARYGNVTTRLILSGTGLERIFDFLRASSELEESPAVRAAIGREGLAAAITRFGVNDEDQLCAATLDMFLKIYGARAGDLALTVLARGGVFIAGGIAPKILSRMRNGIFVNAFGNKDAFSRIVRAIPVRVVLDERVGLRGALRVARELASLADRVGAAV